MSDEPLTFPGDAERDEPIKRRPEDEVQRELAINHQDDPPPGGAEGGDESPSADLPMGLPADDQAEVGSTDQHSDPDRLPEHRERKNQSRD